MLTFMRRHSLNQANINRILFAGLLFLSFLAHAETAPSQELATIVLKQDTAHLSPQGRIAYLVDPTDRLSYEDMLKGRYNSLFQRIDTANLHFGVQENVHWLMLDVTTEQSVRADTFWYLEIANPHLDRVTLFIPGTSAIYAKQEAGRLAGNLDTLQSSHKSNSLLFKIPSLRPGINKLLFRIQHQGETVVPMSFWAVDKYIGRSEISGHLSGLYYGLMLALLIYNLYVFINVKDHSYLLFLLLICSVTCYQWALEGAFYQFLGDDSKTYLQYINPVLSILVIAIATIFVEQFLSRNSRTPGLTLGLNALVFASGGLLLVLLLVDPASAEKISLFYSVMAFGGISVVSWLNYSRFNSIPWVYLTAWGLFLVSSLVRLMIAYQLISYSAVILVTLQWLTLIEILMLSWSLANRFSVRNKEVVNLHIENISDLERSNRLKDEFLATLSHELRTPMNGVIGGVELIKCTDLSGEQKSYLTSVSDSALDMISLIDTILGYTEVQSGDLKLKEKPFNLAHKLIELTKAYNVICERKGLTLLSHDYEDLNEVVVGDPQRFVQVLMQLLDNAVKYTNDGSVTLIARRVTHDGNSARNHYLITISDTGIGISPQKQKELFQSFRQLDGSYSREQGGVGIGLALSKKLVDLMGGDLTFHSKEDHGSMFEFSIGFKCYERMSEDSEADNIEKNVVSLSSFKLKQVYEEVDLRNIVADGRVLVVEDNRVNQMVLKTMLKKLGYEVFTADNGRKALEVLEKEEIDLILMDCQMPVMDGLEATRRIRQMSNSNANKPILAVTANALSGDKDRCLAAGMNDYINKPLKLNVIKESLEQWLPTEKVSRCGSSS